MEKSQKPTIKDLKAKIDAGGKLKDFSIEELDFLEENAPELEDQLWNNAILDTLNNPESHDKSN